MKTRGIFSSSACIAAIGIALGSLIAPGVASAKQSREQAITALTPAASDGDVEAQLALAKLLEAGGRAHRDEALRWYEKAARAGNAEAQRRYMSLLARPASAPASAPPLRAFIMRSQKNPMDGDDPPPDLPPGYHCHPLGRGQLWCHGGTDTSP